MIFNLVSVPMGQPNQIVNLNHLGDPFPYSVRSHENPGFNVPRKAEGRWSFVQDGHHFYGLHLAVRRYCWELVLPSVCGPYFSRELRDSLGQPSLPLKTSLLQPSSTDVPVCWGTPVSAPCPCSALTSEKVKTLFCPTSSAQIILSHPSSYFLIPRTRG